MEQLMQKLQTIGTEWELNCPLCKHSTFRIGGVADLAVFPHPMPWSKPTGSMSAKSEPLSSGCREKRRKQKKTFRICKMRF